jgi:hypothetical protein
MLALIIEVTGSSTVLQDGVMWPIFRRSRIEAIPS